MQPGIAVTSDAAGAKTSTGNHGQKRPSQSIRQRADPVFVDFTASWCLSCQVNERVVLNQPEVKKAFADAKVALLRADWTRHDEAITQALTALDRSGVPTYALYSPGEKSSTGPAGSPYPRNCDQCAQQIDQC